MSALFNVINTGNDIMKFKFQKLPSRRHGASNLDQYAYLGEADDITRSNRAAISVILGELVIMQMDEPPQEGGTGYVSQPIRESRRNDFSLSALRSQSAQLYTSIHPDLAQHIATFPKRRYVLAADAILALATRQRNSKTLLICSGYSTLDKTYFDTYLFRHGQLVRVTEAIVKPADHMRYAVDIRDQIEEALTEYPDARILWTPPLRPLQLSGIKLEHVGPEMFAGKCPTLTHDGQTASPSPKAPALATAATIALCLGWIVYDASALTNRRDEYKMLDHGKDTSAPKDLEVLQARANWQKEVDASKPKNGLDSASRLLAAIAQNPEWRIASFDVAIDNIAMDGLLTKTGANTATPVPLVIVMTAPTVPNVPILNQAHPIVAALKDRTGMNLIVGQQGLTTATPDGRLRLSIESEK
jgi:hypothetical protein